MRIDALAIALLLAACKPETSPTGTTEQNKPEPQTHAAPAATRAEASEDTQDNRGRFEAFALKSLPADCVPSGYRQGQPYDEEGNNLLGWSDDLDTGAGGAFEVIVVERRCFDILKPKLTEAVANQSSDLFGKPVSKVTAFPDADGGPTFMIYFAS